jgi:hypothetical protein
MRWMQGIMVFGANFFSVVNSPKASEEADIQTE